MTLPVPFYEADGVTLYCADVMQWADLLPPVDAIIADPPYGETSLKWDVWPAGWPRAFWKCSRQLWCFGSFRMFWEQKLDFAGWKLAQDVVWEKHNGSSMRKDRFRRVHELACHFYAGEWETLYTKVPVVPFENERKRSLKMFGRPAHLTRSTGPKQFNPVAAASYEYDGTRLQRSVIPVRSCHGKAVNETQKPAGIVAPLVEYSVPPGGILLSPFAGSGTDLVVARSQGKRAIGFELREEQCAEIVRRLAQGELLPGL